MQNDSNLFSSNGSELPLSLLERKLDVVRADFLEVQTLTWEELFDGFDTMLAITYSSGIDFVSKLLSKFKNAQIIFGCEDVISYSLQEIIAYQSKTIERLKENAAKNKINLLSRIDDGSLNLFVSRKQLSHEKIYLLSAEDGRTRVVMGSANMSFQAFGGRQRENICFMDNKAAFDWYSEVFEQLKNNSCDAVSKNAFTVSNTMENIENTPVAETVAIKKALVIETDTTIKDEVKFSLDIKNLSTQIAPLMPKREKNGSVLLTPEIIKQTRNRLFDAAVQEKELKSEYPQLVIDYETNSVSLNGKNLDLNPARDEISSDVNYFIEYMSGYEKFHGDTMFLQSRYYEFAVWFFATPFLAYLRNTAALHNQNLFPFPVFGLVYGQSKAGKTTFLETLLKMMIGQKTKIAAPDFTRASIEQLKRNVKGAPIIVDDLTQSRFTQHAVETIKNDDFGVLQRLCSYPAVVISANEDVKAVAPEIIRRTVICRVHAGLKNTEIMKNNIVRRVQKKIGTAFYREYLRRMLEKIPDIIEEIKIEDGIFDVLALSSEIIYAIISGHTANTIPFYVRKLTLENYFSEKVTGSHAIKAICDAWKVNKKSFVVDKKFGELRYNAAQTWEVDRIIKELPEDLESYKSREWVVMNLDKASDFFGINFKKPLFFGFKK